MEIYVIPATREIVNPTKYIYSYVYIYNLLGG